MLGRLECRRVRCRNLGSLWPESVSFASSSLYKSICVTPVPNTGHPLCGIHVSFNSTPTLGLSMFVISRAFLRAAKFAFVLVTLVGTPFALNLCRYKVDTNTTRCLDTVKSIGINVHQMEKHVEFKVKNGFFFFNPDNCNFLNDKHVSERHLHLRVAQEAFVKKRHNIE